MITHIKATVPGVAGNATAAGSFGVAYFTVTVMPVLHAFSILAGIIASVATAVYYIREIKRKK
jgi:hypothetical protein